MPRETVYDEAELYDVQVGWASGRDVQVGIETHDGTSVVSKLAAGNTDKNPPAQFTGLWASLDRDGVNRLIRTLRKARDSAFGRDE